MTDRQQELEQQIRANRAAQEAASVRAQARDELARQEQERQAEWHQAAAGWHEAGEAILALLPANQAAVSAFVETADGMVSAGVVHFSVLRAHLTAIDDTIRPIADITARAQGEANTWWQRQPEFDSRNPLGIGARVSSPFQETLPKAADSAAVLETWVTTSPPVA